MAFRAIKKFYSPGNLLASDSGASYTYDSNGNLTRKTGGGVTAQYVYDAENRLIKATITGGKVITFKYDPFHTEKGSGLFS